MVFHSLKVNRMTDPMGIDRDRLSFSFLWEGEGGPCVCTVWEGDRIATQEKIGLDRSHCFTLAWKPEPGRRYRWQISSWESVSPEAYFETAISFSAPWITPERPVSHPTFVRRFQARQGDARLYITGLGLYEAYLNGHRVGEDLLTPGFTEYTSYVRYQTYDVTALLREDNELQVTLGDGWYKGRFGLKGRTDIYGNRYLLAAELRQNGRTLWQTDRQFEVWSSGFLSSGIYDGECFDANIVPERLCGVELTQAGYPIVPQSGPPVRVMGERKPILIRTPKGEQVLDFGQNMAGLVRFTCRTPKGARVTLQAGEILQQGCFYRDNLRDAKARFDYISDGQMRQVCQHFTYYGFRYMLVEGIEQVDPADFTALVIHSALESTLQCHTSHPKLDRLMANTLWGQKSNFVDIATDCPQRSERLGWTGDTQVFAPTACYQMDCLAFYEKILRDLRVEQLRYDGNLPNYCPSVCMETGGGCAVWSDIATILPWTLYQWYGDRDLLRRYYSLMRDYVDLLRRRDLAHGNTHLYHEGGFGDWLAGDGVCDQSFVGGTDVGFIFAVYYRHSVTLTARAARVLGQTEEAGELETLAEDIREAILAEYFAPNGRFCLDTQTAYVLALHYGIWRDRQRVMDAFRTRLERDFFKIKTGFAGTPLMLPTLFECGLDDYAYRLLMNEELPGWLYAVNMGATTIWERWNSVLPDGTISGTGMNSLNHYAYGSVCQAIYGYIAGLRPAAPGWKRAVIAPRTNWRLREIDLAYRSPSGTYRVAWKLLDSGQLDVELSIPSGAVAQVELPGREGMELLGGDYHFLYRPETDYLHPFSRNSFLYDILRNEDAAGVLRRCRPDVYATATGKNPEFLTMTLAEMAAIPMFDQTLTLDEAESALQAVLI